MSARGRLRCARRLSVRHAKFGQFARRVAGRRGERGSRMLVQERSAFTPRDGFRISLFGFTY
eukprot:364963-Chlamydomonas_euryale.AAC.3